MPMLSNRDQRYAEAYLRMASDARYRPEAPGDGCGGIDLSVEELRDSDRLEQEAVSYALRFAREENTRTFRIGCSNFSTNRAFVWVIEAARELAGGGADGNAVARKLLKMAIEELEGNEIRTIRDGVV
jgi:hypothetical protein